ncbi:TRL-like family protein [Candidatus Magnetomonas plexicatena]|uniref:TRL-like family protein n=1 Tax=Candidatus Magnetomonas plexicatena TaxID=2552947 RepID=UPI001C77F458|nr:hypothetical protein E2O03_015440 [Nitrospirales bacterium LBB_01]
MAKRTLVVLGLMVLMLFTASCGFVADGPFGWVYTDNKVPVAIGPALSGAKAGQACIHSFFGAVAIGDASIETAMKAAGIKTVYTINKANLNIFGTYTRQCTIVAGE